MHTFALRAVLAGASAAALLITSAFVVPHHASAAFPGAAGLVAYSSGGEIWVVAATPGAEPVQLTDNDTADTDPSWSPDGRRIVFVSTRAGGNQEIWVMDADGANPTRLTDDPRFDSEPVFSPDGSRIAFSRYHPDLGMFAIWTMEADGDAPVATSLVPPDPGDPFPVRGHDEGASWSPDGSTIAFSRRSGDFDVWLMDADGTHQRPVALRAGTDEMRPDWAPDGSKLVVATDSGDSELALLELDGTMSALGDVSQATRPSWSPDGGRVVYTGSEGLTTIDVESGVPVPLGTVGSSPDWQPLPPPRPDLEIRKAGQRGWTGDDVYTFKAQQLTAKEDKGDTVSISVRLQNDGRAADAYVLRGTASKQGYAVEYLFRGDPVTDEVVAGTFAFHELSPGERSDVLTVEVTLRREAVPGSLLKVVVTARATDAALPVDKVGVTVARR